MEVQEWTYKQNSNFPKFVKIVLKNTHGFIAQYDVMMSDMLNRLDSKVLFSCTCVHHHYYQNKILHENVLYKQWKKYRKAILIVIT